MSTWPKDVPLSRERWNERYGDRGRTDATARTERLIPGSKVIVQDEIEEKE